MFVLYYIHLFFYSVPTKVSEVRASVAVVDCVLHVQKCFSQMLTNMRQLSTKVDIKNVRFFLESILEADEFNTCKGFEDVLRLLRKSYIDAFNTSYLEQLAEYLKIYEITEEISTYKKERDAFFKDAIVTEFQDSVFNKVELSGEDGIMVPEVIVPRSLVNKRTQRDMETLATLFCGSYQKPVVQMDNVPESSHESNWPVYIAVLLAIITLLLVIVLAIIGIKLNSSLSEIDILNQRVKELGAQLVGCQKEKHTEIDIFNQRVKELGAQLAGCQKEKHAELKGCQEEVKDLTVVKGRFLSMKEETNNNSLATAEHADGLMNLLSKEQDRTSETEMKRNDCEKTLRSVEVEARTLITKIAVIVKERDECEFSRHSCIEHLEKCKASTTRNNEVRKQVSSKHDNLTKSYTQCSERLTTCEESCQLYSLLYSRKCFKVMWGDIGLICQPIFVM